MNSNAKKIDKLATSKQNLSACSFDSPKKKKKKTFL